MKEKEVARRLKNGGPKCLRSIGYIRRLKRGTDSSDKAGLAWMKGQRKKACTLRDRTVCPSDSVQKN
jgi:hypothetical protein